MTLYTGAERAQGPLMGEESGWGALAMQRLTWVMSPGRRGAGRRGRGTVMEGREMTMTRTSTLSSTRMMEGGDAAHGAEHRW